jgi:uncharacterized protein YukE
VTGTLRVNPGQLRTSGSSFATAGDKLAAMDAGAPLGSAASAVANLQTAGACSAAADAVSQQMTAFADAARTYGDNLRSAADKYEATDTASGKNIAGVGIPTTR